MENLDELTKRSLRAYELGRFRMAVGIVPFILPVAALCLLDPAFREQSACCATVLLGAAIWFRFRDRRGVEGVTSGLLAGAAPLTLALVLTKVDPACAQAGLFSYCTAVSILGGIVAGVLAAMHVSASRTANTSWGVIISIAVLAASLGCLRLGLASVAGAGVGILLGSSGARFRSRPFSS